LGIRLGTNKHSCSSRCLSLRHVRYVLPVRQQLLEENPLHFGQCLLTGALVVCAVGGTRPRHKRLDYLYLLRRGIG
jgi:hypothetical protein